MKTPDRVYIPEFAKESFKTMDWCPSKDRRSKDEDVEYIRKDISDENAAKKYFEGMTNAQHQLNLFTKEQVVELMKRTWYRAEDHSLAMTFEVWLEQENPFGSIQKDENKLLGSYNSGDKL